MNQTVIESVVMSKTKKFDFENYTLHVDGNACRITVPVLGDKDQPIDMVMVSIRGKEFNEFWSSFTSDKQIVDLVMKAQGVSVDLSTIDDSIVNAK